MNFADDYLREAHKHCANHRAEIEASARCGCFYCLEAYAPYEIKDWLAESEGTALCAGCGIDSVMGDASGFPVADRQFLAAMHEFWFERTVTLDAGESLVSEQPTKSLSARITGWFIKKTT